MITYFISPEFGTEEDLRKIFSWEASVEQYTSEGGTSKAAVLLQLQQLEKWIKPYEILCKRK